VAVAVAVAVAPSVAVAVAVAVAVVAARDLGPSKKYNKKKKKKSEHFCKEKPFQNQIFRHKKSSKLIFLVKNTRFLHFGPKKKAL
jgi:hypothetical protein